MKKNLKKKSRSIRISEREYLAISRYAKKEGRSISDQLEFCSKIGRMSLMEPSVPLDIIIKIASIDWHSIDWLSFYPILKQKINKKTNTVLE